MDIRQLMKRKSISYGRSAENISDKISRLRFNQHRPQSSSVLWKSICIVSNLK